MTTSSVNSSSFPLLEGDIKEQLLSIYHFSFFENQKQQKKPAARFFLQAKPVISDGRSNGGKSTVSIRKTKSLAQGTAD